MSVRDRIIGFERVRAGDLLADERNWRQHPDPQRTALRAVLAEVGFAGAILVREQDGRRIIVDGHLRADMDPEAEVPILVTDLDEAEAGKLLATYDPISAMAETDTQALSELLASIETSSEDMAALLKRVEFDAKIFPNGQNGVSPDDVPELPTPVTQPGDLWALGPHRLLCGEALDAPSSFDGAGLLVADPPYGIVLDTDYSKLPKTTRGFLPMQGDDLPFDASRYRERWSSITEQFWFGANYYARSLGDTEHSGAWLVWDKRVEEQYDAGFGSVFELVWSATRRRQEILRHPWFQNHAEDPSEASGRLHPTQKPVALVQRLLDLASDGAVLDPFAGSGTTIIAAEQVGRTCYAMDIEPRYCDVSVARWERYTGNKAEKVTG